MNDGKIEFKPTEYYITYDIETFEKFIQQNYGEDSATIFYKLIFLDQWLDQVFEEAKQIKKDNKYEDESIPQHFEVPVIGFNSAKFDVSLVFKNLKSKNCRIIKHIDSGTVAKQIIVRHKDTHIQLRFIDALIYCTKMTLKKSVRDIGRGTMQKSRKDITGGLCNVLHRYNIAGETRINHLEYQNRKKLQITFMPYKLILNIVGAITVYKQDTSHQILQTFNQTKMHIIQLDTDSLTLAISCDKNRGLEQRFDAINKDIEFYNKNKGFFFSEDNQRKILGVHTEKQGLNRITLRPKNYIINDECGDVSLVAKDVILQQNPQINEQTFVDNIKSGIVMKVTNTILAQKNKIMSKLSMTKNENDSKYRIPCSEPLTDETQKYNVPKRQLLLKRPQPIPKQEMEEQRIHTNPYRTKSRQASQNQIQDYQLKPLNKLQRPYFSPKSGSYEIDLAFSSDSEKGLTDNVIKKFCNNNNISLYFNSSPFTQHNRVVDRVIRTIRDGIQRQEFRASANDLQLLLIRRLQKT
ncbi:MAG: hypothetical protein EZS28_014713, partial [Streblomastix strix]